ncbi:MAG: Tripartite ATP-independent periplasmic transporter DctQ component [candidate division NC10 bacterium]|jgi:C4-dicarboxylate transporter DctQ subunit|nr:Tripartite ATP-independent periplasmic transporter DctQ component [candidate division NC10 bacterium]
MWDRINRTVGRAEDVAVGLIILFATYVLFQGVVLRYVFNYAFPWTEEVVRYSIVWLVFLGGSIAARRGAHIAMDIVVVYLPPRLKLFFMGVATALTFVFTLIMTYYGCLLTWSIWSFDQRSPAAEIPMAIPFAAIPVGCALMTIRFLVAAVAYFRGIDPFKKRAHLEA